MGTGAKEQLDILMRATQFADEVEGADPDVTSEAPVPGRHSLGAAVRADLREQMRNELGERLKEGRPLRVYLGVDPTAESLHIGHLVPVLKLRQFQDLGHQVVFLIGDYTGLIGDPSGRTEARQTLDSEALNRMAAGYEAQVFKILDPERTEVRRNSEWLSGLQLKEIIRLASLFPLKQIVARRDFKQRMDRGESLRFHEALYALMQGYDAYALECDVQVGGYDQHFNLLAGRVIQAHFGQKPHVMITLPLLPGTDGRKMSKTYANAIDVTDKPEDMFGKVMRISDPLIPIYLDLACLFDPAEADRLKADLKNETVNPMDVKKRLAIEVTRLYHGDVAADHARNTFERISQERRQPEDQDIEKIDVEEIHLNGKTPWPQVLADLKLVDSRSAAKRLMGGGGFKVAGEAVKDWKSVFTPPRTKLLIQVGKRGFYYLKRPKKRGAGAD